ncbi:MAG: type VI secretion protein ImpB, partial [Alphaproteobacteria bacterium]|nr:type VI secretion protein ImpB [Alphaproteobacteria bacterium]
TLVTADELPARLHALKLRDITGIAKNMERRLLRKGIFSVKDWLALDPNRAGQVWGGRNGDRMWFLLHGYDLPDVPTTHRSIGHSNVLAPENRGLETAHTVVRRLAFKASARLRREGYLARGLLLHAQRIDFGSVGYRGGPGSRGWAMHTRIPVTDDSFDILSVLEAQLWPALAAACQHLPRNNCLTALGITLIDIVPHDSVQGELFAPYRPPPPRSAQLGQALDAINARFGRNAVMLGMPLGGRDNQVGAKIAFTRIPDLAEFHE